MDANTLCTLLAEKIDPAKFLLWGTEIKWLTTPTKEETALASDVIANYDTLAATYKPRVTSLTPYQAREQMSVMGVLDQVESAIAAAGASAIRKWEYATVILRDDPLFLSIKEICQFTDEQVEQFFNEGSLI
jgi:hypothetical protein